VYDEAHCRIEMRLVSQRKQRARVGDECFEFETGEIITTEYSYKFTCDRFARVAGAAGWATREVWTDPKRWFAVLALERTA
jgi:L-histidine Nalpha-methyltransferase